MSKHLPIQDGRPEMPYFKVLFFPDTRVVIFLLTSAQAQELESALTLLVDDKCTFIWCKESGGRWEIHQDYHGSQYKSKSGSIRRPY